MCDGGKADLTGERIEFAADCADAFFEFDDQAGIIANFEDFEVKVECEVVGPVAFRFPIVFGIKATVVSDEMGQQRFAE